MQKKRCRKCREEKTLENFTKASIGKYGVNSTCRECEHSKVKKTSIKQVSATNKNTSAKFSKEVKEKMLERDGGCVNCPSKLNIEYHHAYFGGCAIRSENRNDLNQGVCLCHDCHHSIHHGNDGKGQEIRRDCVYYLVNLIK